ncbi:hypothetical protein DI392_15720 [Vibrio albus]|uniref:Gingipain domain-containing protein n=1 Tax=Vibrio albus TaxID=2200953 RepID=A0A2U3B6T6_9VIBR|nr:C25 family cysteine peptidase [Vibrio albus]PWI32497.1 hypothetical protein DI392_15720 [Vibrio albus]
MKKPIQFLLMILLMVSYSGQAEVSADISTANPQTVYIAQAEPSVDVSDIHRGIKEINRSQHSVQFVGYVEKFIREKVTLAGTDYTRITLPGSVSDAAVGEPNIPAYERMIEIAEDVEITLQIDEQRTQWSPVYSNILIEPVQPPIPDAALPDGTRLDLDREFIKHEAAYASVPKFKPLVEIQRIVKGGGKRFAVLKYRPIRYNPLTQELQIASQVYFELVISTAPLSLRQSLVSPQSDEKQPLIVTQNNAEYLIVTPAEYVDVLVPFVEWKKKLGYRVFVATLEETGSTYDPIKQYVQSAHQTENPLKYLLLIGDHEQLPAQQIVGHPFHDDSENNIPHTWHTDYGYTLLEGEDFIADVAVGRMPADTREQLAVMLQRSMDYQRNPPRDGRFDEALVAGQFQDRGLNSEALDGIAARMFMEDVHRVADFIGPDFDFFIDSEEVPDPFNKGYTVHTALFWEGGLLDHNNQWRNLEYQGWDYLGRLQPPQQIPEVWLRQGEGSDLDISAAINRGVGLVMHRDHGYSDGSGWAHPHYQDAHASELFNAETYPFVFSLNCATGWFDGKDAFAESWLLNANGGVAGFLGAARVSYSGYNDLLHVGLFDTFWEDYEENWTSIIYGQSWRPAVALNRAKERLFVSYGIDDNYAQLTARLFNYLGDPELELRTAPPVEYEVTHPARSRKHKPISFAVTVTNNDIPVKNAEVILSLEDNNPLSQMTDESGVAEFDITPTGHFTVVVNKHNTIPYQNTVTVYEPLPLASPQSSGSGGSTFWGWAVLICLCGAWRHHKPISG